MRSIPTSFNRNLYIIPPPTSLMTNRYEKWISENVKDAYGKCAEYTESMNKVFPELLRIRGHYHCPIQGKRPHWWLKTLDNIIVDPTRKQFASIGLGDYEEWDETQEEPTGKCLNCGDYRFGWASVFCSDTCREESTRYLNDT